MIPFLGRRRTASKPSKLWAALVALVVRRPAAWGAVGAIAMLALAAPALSLKLGNPPYGGFPASVPVIKTVDRPRSRKNRRLLRSWSPGVT
jgi:putative drug exporter of the RND superfamily